MKKLLYLLPLLALATACHKFNEPVIDPVETTPNPDTYPIEFVSERPQGEDGTRTYWDGSTILWNPTDWIRMGYTVDGVWQNATGSASGDAAFFESQGTVLSEDGGVASFTTNVNFAGTTQGVHEFYAVYPGAAAGEAMPAAPTATIRIPATQTPLATSFDPAADLMLGHSVGTYNSRPTEPVQLVWDRVVAHGQITLKGLNAVAGEKVNTITLTAQVGANLVGPQEMDITTGTYHAAASNAMPNRIVINGENLTLVDGADGRKDLTFWIGILPASITGLLVQVETDKATYTRAISCVDKPRVFLANRRNLLNINMSGATRATLEPSPGDFYTLVKSEADLGEGHYLITFVKPDGSANVLSGKATGNNNYGVYVNVPVANNKIAYDDAGAYDVVIEKTANGYSMKLGNQYLGYTSTASTGSNYLYFSTSFSAQKYEWTLSVNSTNGEATVTSVYNTARKLQWNNDSNSLRFACYASNQNKVKLFKWSSTEGPSVTTAMATDITVASATLNARFANLGTTSVQDVHFLWGTSPDDLTNILPVGGDFDVNSGEFHATLSSLDENTVYYYQAVLQYCTDGVTYFPLEGEVMSFRTLRSSTGGNVGIQWLTCNEIPAINLVNTDNYSGKGKETFGNTHWYNYETTNSMQKVITHSYSFNGKTYRNYTALIDGNKRCPIWTAYPVHSTAYPTTQGVKRGSFDEDTSYDPGILRAWQSSGSTSDYNQGNGYSRGHHCASADRLSCRDANDETFYYTNQSPQWQNSFNSGIWGSLEEATRAHLPSGRDTLYIVVGTLFENGNTGPSNDGGTVARPSHYYKLLMKCSFATDGTMTNAQGSAFLYTNEPHTGSYSNSEYLTSIAAIEDRTGFDFFTNVPTTLQYTAEQHVGLIW